MTRIPHHHRWLRRRPFVVGLVVAVMAGAALAQEPIEFEGLGLEEFAGTGSIAAELDRIRAASARERLREDVPDMAVSVQGPSGRDALPVPLLAELRSRIERFDVAAGLQADPLLMAQGPARWTGRIGVSSDRDSGRESLELRTMLGNNAEWGLIGVEVGPRVERRLRRGVTVFIDGKAEAQATRSSETGWWSLPGTSTDGASMMGVMARTGFVH